MKNPELEKSIATSLSAVLIAIATFSLAALTQIKLPKETATNDLLVMFGMVALLTAALLIDALLDQADYTIGERFKMLNRGYALFCLIVSAMSVAIIWFYSFQELSSFNEPLTRWVLIPLTALAGMSTFTKLMTKADTKYKDAFTTGFLILSYISCFAVVKMIL